MIIFVQNTKVGPFSNWRVAPYFFVLCFSASDKVNIFSFFPEKNWHIFCCHSVIFFFFLSESFFMISSWFSSYLGIKQSCLYPVLAAFFLVIFIYNILTFKYVNFPLCEKLRWEVVWILQGFLSSFLCRVHSLLIFAISFISLHISTYPVCIIWKTITATIIYPTITVCISED